MSGAGSYGRECGCTYAVEPPATRWKTDEVYHPVNFQATRNGQRYQSSKHAYLPTAEAALAKAEAMVEAYRKRCAKQIAPKVSDVAA